MSAPPVKRQRANTEGEAAQENESSNRRDYRSIIDTLDMQTLKDQLHLAANLSPAIGEAVYEKYQNILAAERARVVDFDFHSKSVWRILRDGERMSGSRAYDASFDGCYDISASIKTILTQTTPYASIGTKKNH